MGKLPARPRKIRTFNKKCCGIFPVAFWRKRLGRKTPPELRKGVGCIIKSYGGETGGAGGGEGTKHVTKAAECVFSGPWDKKFTGQLHHCD